MTSDHLFRLVEESHQGFRSGNVTASLFLDAEAAFDKCWHDGLRYKLKNPKYIKHCVDTQKKLHHWVTCISTAKNGKHLYENYRHILEDVTHAHIDILSSKTWTLLAIILVKCKPLKCIVDHKK